MLHYCKSPLSCHLLLNGGMFLIIIEKPRNVFINDNRSSTLLNRINNSTNNSINRINNNITNNSIYRINNSIDNGRIYY